jgi:hypothetical protein
MMDPVKHAQQGFSLPNQLKHRAQPALTGLFSQPAGPPLVCFVLQERTCIKRAGTGSNAMHVKQVPSLPALVLPTNPRACSVRRGISPQSLPPETNMCALHAPEAQYRPTQELNVTLVDMARSVLKDLAWQLNAERKTWCAMEPIYWPNLVTCLSCYHLTVLE